METFTQLCAILHENLADRAYLSCTNQKPK